MNAPKTQKRMARIVAIAALAIASSAQASVPPAEAVRSLTVEASHDRATVRAADVPLRQILAELSTQTGVTITGLTSGADAPRSIEVVGIPLTELIHRLLSPRPYLIFIGADGELDRIAIAGAGRGRIEPAPPVARPPEDLPEDTEGRDDSQQKRVTPIKAPLLEAMVAAADPGERIEAVGMLALSGNDAEREVALRDALRHDDDVRVREAAFDALEEHGPVDTSALLDIALSDPDLDLRLQALHRISREEIDDEVLDGLVNLAESSQEPLVRDLAEEIVGDADGLQAENQEFADQEDQFEEPEKTGTS